MENLTQLLENLANKLGTTTEYLWGIMIKQAYISGVTSLVWLVIALIGTFFWFQGLNYVRKNWKELYDDESVVWWVMCLVVGIIIISLIFIENDSNFVTALLNPEYWALEKVLETIK